MQINLKLLSELTNSLSVQKSSVPSNCWCGVDRAIWDKKITYTKSDKDSEFKLNFLDDFSQKYKKRRCFHCDVERFWGLDVVSNFYVIIERFGEIRNIESRTTIGKSGDFTVYPGSEKLYTYLDKLRSMLDQPMLNSPTASAYLMAQYFVRIHPFLDGNGRFSRFLAVLLLKRWGVVESVNFASTYFIQEKREFLIAEFKKKDSEQKIANILSLYISAHNNTINEVNKMYFEY